MSLQQGPSNGPDPEPENPDLLTGETWGTHAVEQYMRAATTDSRSQGLYAGPFAASEAAGLIANRARVLDRAIETEYAPPNWKPFDTPPNG